MASNNLKFKKTTIQLILFTAGMLLIFLIYFSESDKKGKLEKLEDVSNTQKDTAEDKDLNIFEDVEYYYFTYWRKT